MVGQDELSLSVCPGLTEKAARLGIPVASPLWSVTQEALLPL